MGLQARDSLPPVTRRGELPSWRLADALQGVRHRRASRLARDHRDCPIYASIRQLSTMSSHRSMQRIALKGGNATLLSCVFFPNPNPDLSWRRTYQSGCAPSGLPSSEPIRARTKWTLNSPSSFAAPTSAGRSPPDRRPETPALDRPETQPNPRLARTGQSAPEAEIHQCTACHPDHAPSQAIKDRRSPRNVNPRRIKPN